MRKNTKTGLAVILLLFALNSLGDSLAAARQKNKLAALVNVQIQFAKKQYTFTRAEVAKGVVLEYRIIVTKDIPGVIPQRQTSADMASPSGLKPFPKIFGNKQLYCIQDVGLGPPTPNKPRTIKKGVYKRTFKWDGKNWTGPSDFGAKKGKAFPAGVYEFSVSMIGRRIVGGKAERYRMSGSVKVVLR